MKILRKREKSLEILSICFLQLFLKWKTVISLEDAANKLTVCHIEENKIKTKVFLCLFFYHLPLKKKNKTEISLII